MDEGNYKKSERKFAKKRQEITRLFWAKYLIPKKQITFKRISLFSLKQIGWFNVKGFIITNWMCEYVFFAQIINRFVAHKLIAYCSNFNGKTTQVLSMNPEWNPLFLVNLRNNLNLYKSSRKPVDLITLGHSLPRLCWTDTRTRYLWQEIIHKQETWTSSIGIHT